MKVDEEKWDRRYREGSYGTRTHGTNLLVDWLPRLSRGLALDVACGTGCNALLLAKAGYDVDAVDISAVALQRVQESAGESGVEINCLHADLDTDPLPAKQYDLIVMIRYVNNALVPSLMGHLNAGGHFLCEQHLVTTDTVVGPRNAAYRMSPGELRALADDATVLHYNEGILVDPDGRRAARAQLVARKPDSG